MIRNFWLYGVLLILIQGLVACGTESDDDLEFQKKSGVAPGHNEKLVVAFGDSLFAGYQLPPNEGLAPQLERALEADGIDARVHNAGVSGDTSAAGKARLPFVLDNLERKPDLVVLGLGGNDMLRGISPDQTRANLTAMLEELNGRDIPVVITGILATPNLGPDYARAFNPIYPELAAKYQASLYPFILEGVFADRSKLLSDNIHPNGKGVARVVEGLSPLVEATLKKNDGTVLEK